jgi:Ca2+-binding EF-hand superfamily protein
MQTGLSATKKHISIQEFVQYLLEDCYQDNEVDEFFRKEFNKIDTNGNGSITAEELRASYAAKGHDVSGIQSEITKSDTNKNEQLEYDEIVESANKEFRKQFDKIDTNDDGVITEKDSKSKGIEFQEDIKEVDTNKDGKIDYNEFVTNLINPVKRDEE